MSLPTTSNSLSPASKPVELQTEAPFNALVKLPCTAVCLLAAMFLWLAPAAVEGQEKALPQGDLAQYDYFVDQLRSSVADTHAASLQFYVNGLEDSYHWKDQWRAGMDKTNRLLADFRATACRIYASDLQQPESLDSMIGPIIEEMYASNQLQDLDVAMEKTLAANPDDIEQKKKLAMVYLKTNRFQQAFDMITSIDPTKIGEFDKADQNSLVGLPSLVRAYAKELEIREQEEQANDLPRVELATSSGTMVVELFENEAPETVANFISLVEAGHYNNALFHRVIPNFMAQCGRFSENNTPLNIGYTINDEFKNKNFRRHFCGSLSMANTGRPNSGSSQFFINLVPTSYLDGKHTVFGTVIEGAAAYQRITLTHKLDEKEGESAIDSAAPDKILSARVLRKRDHAYQPVKASR